MNAYSNKTPNKLGIQKLRSTLNMFGNREKKANPQLTLSSSYADIKKKRHQPSIGNTQSNLDRHEIQANSHNKNNQEIKTNIIHLEKDSTVDIEEGLPAQKKVKNLQDKPKINVQKSKNIQQNKQSSNQRETFKPTKTKQDQKLKQICDQQRAHCSIQRNIYSFQLNGDISKTQSNQLKQLQYQEIGKKLNETMQENRQLKFKLQKLKILNTDSRRSLKDQVISFNIQGEQAKKTKQTLENLQIQNLKLLEELNNIKNQIANYSRRIEQIAAQKKHMQTQNEFQHKNFCQLKQIYNTLKEKYEEKSKEKKQPEIRQHSQIISLQLESKLNRSTAQFDELIDMTIISQIKEDEVHLKAIINEDTDTLYIWKRMEEKYLGMINELKNRLLESEMQNFQLQAEIQQLKQSKNNYESQKMGLNTQTQILLLLMENNRLKIKEYEIKEEIKQVKETLKLSEIQNKQLRVEKESKQEQITATLIHLTNIKHSDQKLRQEKESLKVQLRQSQQLVKKLRFQKQQDLQAKASIVRKIKYFK